MADAFGHGLVEPHEEQQGGGAQPRQDHAEGPHRPAEQVPAPVGLDAAPGGGAQQMEQKIGQRQADHKAAPALVGPAEL